EDQSVARGYALSSNKGPAMKGRRLTVLSARKTCRVGEQVRIIHVYEVTEPGHKLWPMGPKAVAGEYVDGKLVTDAKTENSLHPMMYDGRVLDSPAVDYNFEITSYSFETAGKHRIEWKLDGLQSNVLLIDVSD